MTASLILNIDVPNVDAAVRFYGAAFDFAPQRWLFEGRVAELSVAGQLVHILSKPEGAAAFAGGPARSYGRHWTPLHIDLVVDDLAIAVARAVAAGAVVEREPQDYVWGSIAGLADPFGHGWCLIELTDAGYGAVAD